MCILGSGSVEVRPPNMYNLAPRTRLALHKLDIVHVATTVPSSLRIPLVLNLISKFRCGVNHSRFTTRTIRFRIVDVVKLLFNYPGHFVFT